MANVTPASNIPQLSPPLEVVGLWRRYTIALTLFGCLAGGVMLSVLPLTGELNRINAEINQSGRQRMLSQRIAMLAAESQTDSPDARRLLAQSVLAFARSNAALGKVVLKMHGAEGKTLRALYLNEGLAERSRVFATRASLVAVGRGDDAGFKAIAAEAKGPLLVPLEAAVGAFQARGREVADTINHTEEIAGALALLLILLEAAFIFRPAHRQITCALAAHAAEARRARKAEAAAEAAAAVKSEFLSNMSHELRTPLTSILGFSDLLVEHGGLEGQQRRYLDRIVDASAALLTTVNDVLDFSKLEAGQVEIERRAINPAAVAASALGLFTPQISKKNLVCSIDHQGLPPLVLADDTRLRQVLLNLISNAVKFTAVGGVTVRVSYDSSAEKLRYDVIDTGPGISPDCISQLFQRFSQLDASTTRAFGGTGLGLAICKGLVEAMDGRIAAVSDPGKGSQFWFELPARIAAEETPEALVASFTNDPEAMDGLRVLVVDDSPANRELTCLIAVPFGISVVQACSGAEAAAATKLEPFDVILMDVRMSDIDGVSAAQIIRSEDGPNKFSPIIALSEEGENEVMPPSWNGLFDDRLVKPVLAPDLMGMLARWSPPPRPVIEDDRYFA